MNKKTIIWIVVLAVVLIAVFALVGSYNSLVSLREGVSGSLSNIDTQLQRRNDLIPNLVNTVKGYTTHESEVLGEVSEARTKLAGAATTEEMAAADAQLSSALSRLLMIVENYPDLKADTQFTALSDELAGTENRIAVARKDYNDAARSYNTKIQKFPTVILANLFGFDSVAYFEAEETASQVPQVQF